MKKILLAILSLVICFSMCSCCFINRLGKDKYREITMDGLSMNNTFQNGEKLLYSSDFDEIKTGDIVVLLPENIDVPIIKRVIATEGQTVLIDYEKWEIYVDGVKLDEPYIEPMHEEYKMLYGEDVPMRHAEQAKYMEEFIVEDDKVFVLGDNRNNSKDSRSRDYGELDENCIIGKVVSKASSD